MKKKTLLKWIHIVGVFQFLVSDIWQVCADLLAHNTVTIGIADWREILEV